VRKNTIDADEMCAEYDFSAAVPNPYARKLKQQITIRLDVQTVEYFKEQARQTDIPYQSIINLYLNDCVKQNRRLTFS
jgi:uncharacterized protein (DUF4415 family)